MRTVDDNVIGHACHLGVISFSDSTDLLEDPTRRLTLMKLYDVGRSEDNAVFRGNKALQPTANRRR